MTRIAFRLWHSLARIGGHAKLWLCPPLVPIMPSAVPCMPPDPLELSMSCNGAEYVPLCSYEIVEIVDKDRLLVVMVKSAPASRTFVLGRYVHILSSDPDARTNLDHLIVTVCELRWEVRCACSSSLWSHHPCGCPLCPLVPNILVAVCMITPSCTACTGYPSHSYHILSYPHHQSPLTCCWDARRQGIVCVLPVLTSVTLP